MSTERFDKSVFINCPFDETYAPLLEAAHFCIIGFGSSPRLANERLEAGENRLDKITDMIRTSKYSIHDPSRCRADDGDEYFRMNTPFEYGVDVRFRRGGIEILNGKKFLIFEKNQYDLKRALSDIAGQDVVHHNDNFERVIRHVRDFFRVEAGVDAPGPARLLTDYGTFQEWMFKKKLHEGHSEEEALNLPTREKMDEMRAWATLGKPTDFDPM